MQLVVLALFLTILLPFGAFFVGKSRSKKKFKSMLATNIISFFAVVVVGTIFIFSGHAEAAEATAEVSATGLAYLAAALSTGMATIGAGIATAAAASAAIGALSENEGMMGKALIFVALAEGIALYGMLVSFMILFRV